MLFRLRGILLLKDPFPESEVNQHGIELLCLGLLLCHQHTEMAYHVFERPYLLVGERKRENGLMPTLALHNEPPLKRLKEPLRGVSFWRRGLCQGIAAIF